EGAIGPCKHAESLAVVREPEAEPVAVKLERADVVLREEHHVIDGLGPGPLTPFAVLIQALYAAGSVHRIGLGNNRSLAEHTQPDGLSVIGAKTDRTVCSALDLAIALQIGDQCLEALLCIHAPDGLPNPGPLEVLGWQARIAAVAHRDT